MKALERWHDMMRERNLDRLDEILDDDCVFVSPVVHTPQQGRALTKLYLSAAMNTFNNSFEYVKEIVTDKHAVLEFTCDIDGIQVNGVDIITVGEDGKITEFKVMVRPLKAMNMLHGKMRSMLEQLSA